jgi:hypothetical protein
MKKGETVGRHDLKEDGYKHLLNYGNWEVWAKEDIRIYRDIDSEVIKCIYIHGQSVEEL